MRRKLLLAFVLPTLLIAGGCSATSAESADTTTSLSTTATETTTKTVPPTTQTETTTTAVAVTDSPDDEWTVTIMMDLDTETFTAEGSDIDDGLFCPVGSAILIFEDSSPTTAYWDVELKCDDGSGSFAVSTETFFEPDYDGELLIEDPDTGAFSFVKNSGWWIVEDAIGDYTGITNVRSIGYQELSINADFGIYQTMYGGLKRDS